MKRSCILILAFFALFTAGISQEAGSDQAVVTGCFKNAVSFSVDPDNNFFVIDSRTSQLLKISKSGEILQTAGGYGWSELVFDQPADVASPNGIDVYVADYGNHRIIRYDRNLNFVSSLSPGDEIYSPVFGYPRSVTVSGSGELFLVDGENIRIVKISRTNRFDRAFGGRDAGMGKLSAPSRVRINSSDIVFCKDRDLLKAFDTFGNYLFTAGEGIFRGLISFTANRNDLFAVDSNYVYRIDEKGSVISAIELPQPDAVKGAPVVDIAVFKNVIYFLTPEEIIARKM